MAEIAEASGLVRATLYRHFPTRDDLIRAMYSAALDDALQAILSVDPEQGKATDAIARVVDALLVVGDRYRILSEERRGYPELREKEESVGAPLIALVERGQRDGELRDDMPLRWIVAALGSLVNEALRAVGREDIDRAEAGTLVTRTFLESMRPRASRPLRRRARYRLGDLAREAAGDHLRGVLQPAEAARVLEPALQVDDQRSGPVLEARLQRMLGEPRDERGREQLAQQQVVLRALDPQLVALVQPRALELHLAARAGAEPPAAEPADQAAAASEEHAGEHRDARLEVDHADREVVRHPPDGVVVGALALEPGVVAEAAATSGMSSPSGPSIQCVHSRRSPAPSSGVSGSSDVSPT